MHQESSRSSDFLALGRQLRTVSRRHASGSGPGRLTGTAGLQLWFTAASPLIHGSGPQASWGAPEAPLVAPTRTTIGTPRCPVARADPVEGEEYPSADTQPAGVLGSALHSSPHSLACGCRRLLSFQEYGEQPTPFPKQHPRPRYLHATYTHALSSLLGERLLLSREGSVTSQPSSNTCVSQHARKKSGGETFTWETLSGVQHGTSKGPLRWGL